MRLKKRFAAMLLFQFRVLIKDDSGKRRALGYQTRINAVLQSYVEAHSH